MREAAWEGAACLKVKMGFGCTISGSKQLLQTERPFAGISKAKVFVLKAKLLYFLKISVCRCMLWLRFSPYCLQNSGRRQSMTGCQPTLRSLALTRIVAAGSGLSARQSGGSRIRKQPACLMPGLTRTGEMPGENLND